MSSATPISADHPLASPPVLQLSATLWPGVVLASIVAAAAFSIRQVPGLGVLSPMILAVILGVVFSNIVGTPTNARPGIAFCQRSLLRFAIVLLGFQLTSNQVLSIGAAGLGLVGLTLAATFVFTLLVGRLMGVDRKLAELIAAGTSICGASAIVATNAVTRARDEDVAYSVASITLFGTIAMVTLPLLAPVMGLDQHHFGLWAGVSIHEVAQVIGASFQYGNEAGEIGTIAKLSRVMMLAPMVIGLGLLARRGVREEAAVRPPLPWFIFAFVAVVAVNSVVDLPAQLKSALALATTLLLAAGLAAMGLQTKLSDIRARGLRPLILALSAFLFITGLSLLLVKLAG